ncbi:MAG: hypothetical protein N2170_07710, partial [Bacteroidia bacterium]|nr:hypothetical protein [Bacteroidia bacterium]
MKKACWIAFIGFLGAQQTVLINPAAEGSFEGSHGWLTADQAGKPNRWCIGGAQSPSHGSACAYISNDAGCSRHEYSNSADTRVHLYRACLLYTS